MLYVVFAIMNYVCLVRSAARLQAHPSRHEALEDALATFEAIRFIFERPRGFWHKAWLASAAYAALWRELMQATYCW